MVTDAHLPLPSESTTEPADREKMGLDPIRGRRLPEMKTLVIILSLGLIAFNLWWYWRDTRPVADLKTIGSWIAHEQYAQAEPALRERLRRAPHDGEARMLLAKAL